MRGDGVTTNFASLPVVNGKKVVLEDDVRLGAGTPTNVPGDGRFVVPADNQALGFVPIRVDGTLVLDGTLVML